MRDYSRLAAALVVAGLVIGAAVFGSSYLGTATTVTETSVTTSTQTTTLTSATTATETITSTSTSVTTSTETTNSTSVTTDYIPIDDSGDPALLADCVPSQSQAYSSGTLVAGASSPAIICVQVYWINPTTPMVLNVPSFLQIAGYAQAGEGQPFDGVANFTVATSVNQLLLGGPTGTNEGTILAFAITAKPGASGTYLWELGGFQLGVQGPEKCGLNGDLVAGTGQPDYITGLASLCIGIAGGPQFSLPGVGYTVPAGVILYRIISLTNSTQ